MIEVKNLTKRYGGKTAVDNISFTVEEGEVLGFLGPNGAGKTTTMNIITGYTSSTEGTVTIGGAEILENPIAAKSRIGYLPEHPPLFPEMTVDKYLSFMYDLKRKPQKDSVSKAGVISEVCDLVKISDVSKRLIRNLSKGYRQRVGLAQALLVDPGGVLILDEPTVGLDPAQIIEIRNLIKELGKTYTIMLSSHILSEVQASCTRIIVINNGRIIADDSPDALSAAMSGDQILTIRVDGPEEDVYELLSGISGVCAVSKLGSKENAAYDFSVVQEPEADVRREMFAVLARQGWPILGLKSSKLSLEEIFLQLTDDGSISDDRNH